MRSAGDLAAHRLLHCGEMRGPACVALVAVSFAVLAFDGCARLHYRVNVTETVPPAAHRPAAVKSGTAAARTGAPTARSLNSLTPSAALPPPRSVGTSGDESPRPQGMQGSSSPGVQPQASIAAGERSSESLSSSGLAKLSRAPDDGSPASWNRSLSPLLVMSIAAAILVAVFALRWIRRDGTLLGH